MDPPAGPVQFGRVVWIAGRCGSVLGIVWEEGSVAVVWVDGEVMFGHLVFVDGGLESEYEPPHDPNEL